MMQFASKSNSAVESEIKMNKNDKKYILSVKRHLFCNRYAKKKYLKTLENSIAEYREIHPDATYITLCSTFGQPHINATEFMSTLDIEQFKKRRRIKQVVSVVLGLVNLLFLSYVLFLLINIFSSMNGRFITFII